MAGKMGEMDINDASLVIVAHPTRGLVDEKFHVDVLNLRPHQPITLHSVFQSEENDFWEAYGHYISDSKGMVKGLSFFKLCFPSYKIIMNVNIFYILN